MLPHTQPAPQHQKCFRRTASTYLTVDWRHGDVIVALNCLQTFLEPHQSSYHLLVVTRNNLQPVFCPEIQHMYQQVIPLCEIFSLHFCEVHGPGDWDPPDLLQVSLALHQLQLLLSDQS